MRTTQQLSRSNNGVALSFDEYRRLKAIEENYLKGYSVVPLFFPSEDLSEYAHGTRVKKSLTKAMKQYPQLPWK